MSSHNNFNTDEVNAALEQGENLTPKQAGFAMEEILKGKMTDEQLASFITRLHVKGETSTELASLVQTMWKNMPPIKGVDATGALDTCGTGGDKSGTFNISTAVSLVLSAAGVPIAKHGNRAASSQCGAADVLEALGIPVLSADATGVLFAETGFAFLFAQTFHPGMRFAAPVRKSLGVPTTFNFLGPLANPYHAPYRLHGVNKASILPTYIETLKELGVDRAYVFHGHGGLDEISLSGVTQGFLLINNEITSKDIDPFEFGFSPADVSALKGGDALKNAEMIASIFDGDAGAPRDIVVLNAAVGYDLVHGVGLAQAIEQISELIDSGAVSKKVSQISAAAQKLAAES